MMEEAALKTRLRATSFVAVLALTLAAGWAPAQESREGSYTKIPTVKGIESIRPGTMAPEFSVKDLEGNEFRLKDARGKDAVVLFFWSFFCGPCREEIPMINEMQKAYSGKGVQVFGVNLDGMEMKKAIEKFVANEKIAFRILFDELVGDSFVVADPYGVSGTPALFVIDKKGVVSFAVLGAVTGDQLKGEIAKALK